jgi:hypothetical protein
MRTQPGTPPRDLLAAGPLIGLVGGTAYALRRKRLGKLPMREFFDDVALGTGLGWIPQLTRDGLRGLGIMQNPSALSPTRMTKTASSTGRGAVVGNLLGGPVGAGVGGWAGKREDHTYHGSPGWRAAGGAAAGGILGTVAGVGLGALAAVSARDPHVAAAVIRLLGSSGALAGSTFGAYEGARSVRHTPRHYSDFRGHRKHASAKDAVREGLHRATSTGALLGAGAGGAAAGLAGAGVTLPLLAALGPVGWLGGAGLAGAGALAGGTLGSAGHRIRSALKQRASDKELYRAAARKMVESGGRPVVEEVERSTGRRVSKRMLAAAGGLGLGGYLIGKRRGSSQAVEEMANGGAQP